jgi:membrane protease YdiL (CAAX protease family)
MWAVAAYLPALVLVLCANLGVRHRSLRVFTYLCLGLLSGLCLFGALLLLGSAIVLRASGQAPTADTQPFSLLGLGLATAVAALVSTLCLLPQLRRWLARWLPLDPASPVHTTALVFYVYLAASSLSLLAIGERSLQLSMENLSLGVLAVVAGEAVFVLLALLGVGLFTRRRPQQLLERLGLHLPSLRHLALAVAAVIGLLGLDWLVSLAWRMLWPTNYELVAKVSQNLFAGFTSPGNALLLGLSAGLGEELLFRGALQPRFRILLTAALFTVVHVQYSISPALLEILAVGLILGWIREKCNTTTCILVHAGYNFLNILLAPLLP